MYGLLPGAPYPGGGPRLGGLLLLLRLQLLPLRKLLEGLGLLDRGLPRSGGPLLSSKYGS